MQTTFGAARIARGQPAIAPGARALAALVLAVFTLGGCEPASTQANPQQQAPPPGVSVAEVQAREVSQWDEFTGHIEAVEIVQIRPRVAGHIERVTFDEGKEVKKNDVLFVIDQRPFKAVLEQAQAELARAQARAKLAQAQAERAKRLIDTRAISEDEYDERVAAATQAAADIRAAAANVEVARLDLDYTEIRSPIDGRAGRALVTPGNLISGGAMVPDATLLTTVVSLNPVYVYFEGDERTYLRYAELARKGERVSSREAANPVFVGLADETGFPHEGRMDFVDNRLDPSTGTIRARAVLDNKDRIFTPGLFARVKLLGSGKFSALLIDEKAVLTDQDRKYVYVLGAGNTAQRRDVKLGRLFEGLRIVESGLAAGDQLIVHGVQKIFFPGMAVAPQTISMGDPPPPPPAAVPADDGGQPVGAAQEPAA